MIQQLSFRSIRRLPLSREQTSQQLRNFTPTVTRFSLTSVSNPNEMNPKRYPSGPEVTPEDEESRTKLHNMIV